jgi:hypothetical protein
MSFDLFRRLRFLTEKKISRQHRAKTACRKCI